jgi:BolA protein|tara:strand:+ start:30 stop:290 length:261 start_codon:yes stop_codon:yes gene_type:complete
MKYSDRIKVKLEKNFSPSLLVVTDESNLHVGHAGYQPGGETHFKVEMVSTHFVNQSRVHCQRMVYKVLEQELQERVHALSLVLSAP